MVYGEQCRRGANSPAGWLRCGGAAGRRRPCAHGAKKPGAERERSASTQAMRMRKWVTVHASDEKVRSAAAIAGI
eukprot:5232192-Pleurochrysis_carterae.AAC.1